MTRKLFLTMILAAVTAVTAGGAAAVEEEREVKIVGGDDDEIKVEVVEEDGVSRVKIWKIVDGEEVLLDDFADDAEGLRSLELEGRRIVVIKDDGEAVRFGEGGDEDVFFHSFGDGEDFAWTVAEEGAWLGVKLDDLDDAKAEYFEVKDGAGALVAEVVEDSPAAAAGFRIYDVIVKIDDEAMAAPSDVIEAVRAHEAGDKVKVTVLRKGKTKRFEAELGERPERDFAFAAPRMHREMRVVPRGRMERLHQDLSPLREEHSKELDNLRADIEELRAMIEELKAER